MPRLKLKFQILKQYGSQAAFSIGLKKTDDWVSRIVTGRKQPTEDERRLILNRLHLPHSERALFDDDRGKEG